MRCFAAVPAPFLPVLYYLCLSRPDLQTFLDSRGTGLQPASRCKEINPASMGMDCVPLNPKAGGYHANWAGWSFIRETLKLLGADIRAMSGSNSGEVVDRETAQDWSRRLQEALDTGRLKIVLVPDSRFFGGTRTAPSLTQGTPARLHPMKDPWLREAIDFFERCGGFQQY